MMNEIETYENFFPEDLRISLIEVIEEKGWKYGWLSNNKMGFGHWNCLISPARAENGIDISDTLPEPFLSAWNHVKENYCKNSILLRCYANAHTYGIEGYPHRDSSRNNDRTYVVYLNRDWKDEWGGETTVYDENGIIHSELPSYNRGLSFPSKMKHVARGVTRICPQLRVTLMFKTSTEVDLTRNKVQTLLTQLGADKIKHSHSNFMAHLLNTYDLLKNKNLDSDICVGGAIHSIFGTEFFSEALLQNTPETKQDLMSVLGFDAVMYADVFSKINRPDTLENNIGSDNPMLQLRNSDVELAIPMDKFKALCAIEGANLEDQNTLNKYTKLNEFWKNL